MNSLFDPECHRQVLGNRQEAKEQKAREKGGGRRRTGPTRWARQCRAEPTREADPRLHPWEPELRFLPPPKAKGH